MSATTTKIAAGVAGGYLLGRTKKFRLALTLAGLLAGKKLAADPKAIANRIVDKNPELEHLRGQLTDGLTTAAKELALATAASRLEAVTQALQPGEVAKEAGSKAGSAAGSATGKASAKKSDAKGSTNGSSSAQESNGTSSAKKSDGKAPAKKKSSAKSSPAGKSTSRSRSSGRKSTASSGSRG